MNSYSPITRDELIALFQHRDAPQLSIFLDRERPGARKTAILKRRRLLEAAEAQGISRVRTRKLKEELDHVGRSTPTIAFQSSSLTRVLRVPRITQEKILFGDRFHLTPLLEFLAPHRFHILLLDFDQPRLLEATLFAYKPSSLRLPSAFDFLTDHRHERHLGGHSSSHSIRHGHAERKKQHESAAKRFFREICKEVESHIPNENPLVVIGLSQWLGRFAQHATRPFDSVEASPKAFPFQELHAMAKEVVDTPQVSANEYDISGIHQVLPMALEGRVATLQIKRGARAFGRYDPKRRQIITSPKGEDLVNRAAIAALRQGADVQIVETAPTQLVAQLRY